MSFASFSGLVTRIEKNAEETGELPVEDWHPTQVVDVDLSIDSQGQWYHEGQPFTRKSLVRLFSRLLRKEADGHYYLITPAEKARIRVAEVPFLVVLAEADGEGESQRLRLQTNVSDDFWLDGDHPLRVEMSADGEPRPFVRVRANLEARILPQVYYQMVDWAEAREEGEHTCVYLTSCGREFLLGCFS
ncbi:DUF1285 domain-containing protein [Marinospirillum perlucidum]|uniref:DUF1285 domain-containing protein n=1 Tax=Marinospirillum perlucidum TaxID=1982602 RepID=UPI000DF1F556|nr:DUF1285 domain-containing protein [Marinospirillum perlucidum]